ncbi:MAG: glycogen synthase GlgA [Candidatus Omnitrophota bacterium]|nr:glycogen synthase GlgA [Candidatus Omnitrophota bacterium]
MKIISVASEVVPYAKTGGLADVTGALCHEIQSLGHEVLTFLPRYKQIDVKKPGFEVAIDRLEVPMGSEKEHCRVFSRTEASGVQTFFIDQPEFFNRDELYGTPLGDYPDNDRRFSFFQRAVLETLRAKGFAPDIIHCHDWQTGLIPAYLKTVYAADPIFKKTKTIFTVHNLAYQGNFPPDSLPATGLGWQEFKMEKLEFYGKVSFLKGGLVYSDMLTTVSERYSQEIQTKEFGCGLEEVISQRRNSLCGVLNGIDYKEWNPETDTDIAAKFGPASVVNKKENKAALQKENGFKVDPKIPLLGMVSRLVDQKGVDILVDAVEELNNEEFQLVLLGTGEEKYHKVLRNIAKKKKGQFGVHIVFDAKMAKRIYAGSDFFLLPSYYEPCGLGQMIALRYGTIPVVRATGGLADTVHPYDVSTGQGNGFSFEGYNAKELVHALKRSFRIYRNADQWSALVRNAMACDYSWAASAKKYIRIYEMTERRTIKSSGK